jgi:hypothetical protein
MVWWDSTAPTRFSVILHAHDKHKRFNEKLPVNLVPANFLTRSLFNAPSKAICNLFANLFFGLLAQVIALLIGSSQPED